MSGESSNEGEWFTWLEPPTPPEYLFHRADDLRLGDIVEYWRGEAPKIGKGQAVLVGFPQDEGIRRHHGRPGAAQARTDIQMRVKVNDADRPRAGYVAEVVAVSGFMTAAQD